MIDNKEVDTKILALELIPRIISNEFYKTKKNYNGLLDIIILWLKNYMGEV